MKRILKINRTENSLMAIALLGLFSCGSDIRYEVKIENKTNYHLDSLLVGIIGDTILTVVPQDESGSFTITRRDNLASFFSEPLLSVRVVSYSDSTSRYTNNIGHVISFSALFENRINPIIITVNDSPDYKSDKFKFTMKGGGGQNGTQ